MIRSLSISGVITLNLHSLNNEGTEGNQQLTRQVRVVGEDGRDETVNAISGDMFKHGQCEYLRAIAIEMQLPLCAQSRLGNANRINADEAFQVFLKQETEELKRAKEVLARLKKVRKAREKEATAEKAATGEKKEERDVAKQGAARKSDVPADAAPDADAAKKELEAAEAEVKRLTARKHPGSKVQEEILRRCALTDMEGTLVTQEGYSVARKSVVEFGWIVGRPGKTKTESYLHVKYDPESRGASTGEDANLGQALFHRPASSGEYATVAFVDLDRVGRNDITFDYPVAFPERQRRKQALLRSLAAAYGQPKGAQRNTQHPHVVAFRGVIAVSRCSLPAPTVSGLSEGYREQIAGVAAELRKLAPGDNSSALEVRSFDDMASFVSEIAGIVDAMGSETES